MDWTEALSGGTEKLLFLHSLRDGIHNENIMHHYEYVSYLKVIKLCGYSSLNLYEIFTLKYYILEIYESDY